MNGLTSYKYNGTPIHFINMEYCKPPFIRVREFFAGSREHRRLEYFSRENQKFNVSYNCLILSRKLVAVNLFITVKSRNKIVRNKSWFTMDTYMTLITTPADAVINMMRGSIV